MGVRRAPASRAAGNARFRHFHPGEEFIYVLAGKLECQIEGEPPR
jgi:quercetin dioxygenase-like cupin family protein